MADRIRNISVNEHNILVFYDVTVLDHNEDHRTFLGIPTFFSWLTKLDGRKQNIPVI